MTMERKDRELYETPKATALGKVAAVTFGATGAKGPYRTKRQYKGKKR
ncbi:MAG: hypothetical protein QOF33_3499 [Thermomicrobiales bacterium]|jgi:hypothetical protein|nr:hypothetical protein [Thermomicrobiales bacterium]MEA2527427.1 hypothetical protein [Thermomicrobiales bacterium]MEA2585414.1 hypothetical protein [Thermomicrobiales bacterium]MEA2595752.1 hypothetical protein [Thermomicrobiales bacterium]